MEDVRVYRGADAGSDHELMIASLKVRLATSEGTSYRTTTDNSLTLPDSPDQRHDFCNALQNRYQTLTDQDEHFIDAKWEHIRTSYHAACDEKLGFRKKDLQELVKSGHHCKDTIKSRLLQAKTRAQKQAAQKEYKEQQKEARRSTRQDKRSNIDQRR